MEFASGIVIALFGFAFAFLRVYFWYKNPYGRQLSPKMLTPFDLRPEDINTLEKYFPYYRSLLRKSRNIFKYRLIRFIRAKKFISRSEEVVSREMKLLIGAAAIQLTFGLPRVYLSFFHRILIYPDSYYSTINKQYHKGEVNPRARAIVLSWKGFVHGQAENEGINLGLHEMAHALRLENAIRNTEFDFLPDDTLKKWDKLAGEEIQKIRNRNGSGFFREYASTNLSEFFAVAVENFFERPTEFGEAHEDLYLLMVEILNQDPQLLAA